MQSGLLILDPILEEIPQDNGKGEETKGIEQEQLQSKGPKEKTSVGGMSHPTIGSGGDKIMVRTFFISNEMGKVLTCMYHGPGTKELTQENENQGKGLKECGMLEMFIMWKIKMKKEYLEKILQNGC